MSMSTARTRTRAKGGSEHPKHPLQHRPSISVRAVPVVFCTNYKLDTVSTVGDREPFWNSFDSGSTERVWRIRFFDNPDDDAFGIWWRIDDEHRNVRFWDTGGVERRLRLVRSSEAFGVRERRFGNDERIRFGRHRRIRFRERRDKRV